MTEHYEAIMKTIQAAKRLGETSTLYNPIPPVQDLEQLEREGFTTHSRMGGLVIEWPSELCPNTEPLLEVEDDLTDQKLAAWDSFKEAMEDE